MSTNEQTLRGLGNHHQSEALNGALPLAQNSPQKVPYDLYAEQITGSAFTAPRVSNFKTWCYRIQPSVVSGLFSRYESKDVVAASDNITPNQYRFSAFDIPSSPTDFVDGLHAVCVGESANIYIYAINQSMDKRYFYNADGELLFVPQFGTLHIKTELGPLSVSPKEIAVIPRGIKFQIENNEARGYICENTSPSLLKLPDLGPIGANGLANPHDFIYPHADFFDKNETSLLICKYQNHYFQAELDYCPLNVVAWRGNYAPYKYDLSLFNTINTVSFDHPDPSIFTVLTSQTNTPGVANIDFVIFPERWMVAEHTFRPPYFHRNIMSEFMGLIEGQYDAKNEGFEPGGFSIHNMMSAHGPDSDTYHNAVNDSLDNVRYENTLAFMFESYMPWHLTEQALNHHKQQGNYTDCWQGLKSQFSQSK